MTNTKTIAISAALALLIISAGCSAFVDGGRSADETPTSTKTSVATSEDIETTTPVPTESKSTPAATEGAETETKSTTPGELSKAQKFEEFDENMQYLYDADKEKRSADTEAFPANDSYRLTVEMRDTTNFTKTRNDRLNPLWKYYAIVEDYNNNDDHFPERDHTYIPDTVNITFVTEDGGVFETTYIKYNWAYKYYTDEWSIRLFMAKYGSTTKEGPAYHENGR
ncbi:hypothetical protein [Haloarcula argentinensis]|uniref:Uncharacterized protein n=1 Tax=Haloarcula argentinensis TaxID=43776 RepID=A0A830FFM4_HALAR|nr:hypothetical protein [Haloarcula argentinensis]GGM41737.1 hypothetical protein GCM10009006_23800 [Haloarcula argentinensis]